MAIDWSAVKAVKIPEGDCKRVAINGIIVWEKSGLPSEYQQVEYITATGQQYIDTRVIPNSNMRIVASGITGSNVGGSGFLFGSRTTTNTARFWIVTWQAYYKLGLGSSHNVNVIRASTNEDFTFDFNHNANHAVTVNGTTVGSVTVNDGIGYLYSIYVFGLNEKNSLNAQKTPCSFKRFTIYNSYEDAEPSMDLIPCYRIADGEIGMYDLANGEFYTNSGSGTFIKGEDV